MNGTTISTHLIVKHFTCCMRKERLVNFQGHV